MVSSESSDSLSSPLTPRPPSHLPFDFHKPTSHSAHHTSHSSSYQASHPHWPHLLFPSHWQHLPHLSGGAGPFTTRLVHQTPSGHTVHWESRKHRKRLKQHVQPPNHTTHTTHTQPTHQPPPTALLPFYRRWFPFKPAHIAWWTAVLFDVGSLCFVFSSVCLFIPAVYESFSLDVGMVGWAAFAGSVCFTIGAMLQLCEVVSTPITALYHDMSKQQRHYMQLRAYKGRPQPQQQPANGSSGDGSGGVEGGGHPSPTRGNLSSLLYRLDFHVAWIQLIGAISFNINTFAFSGSFVLTAAQLTGLVDFCDIFASCCFTISGYLSILEVTHTLLPFKRLPLTNSVCSIDWWLTWFNFLGGVGFLVNGVLIVYWPDPGQLQPAYPLLIGSVFFQLGSHLQYMEQSDTHNTNREQSQGEADTNGAGQQQTQSHQLQQSSNELQKMDANGDEGHPQGAKHWQTTPQGRLEQGEGGRGSEDGHADMNGHYADGVH